MEGSFGVLEVAGQLDYVSHYHSMILAGLLLLSSYSYYY